MLRTIDEVWTPALRAAVEACHERTEEPETRTRCQMALLAGDQGLRPSQIAAVVRRDTATVHRVLRRFIEEGLAGVPRRHAPGPMPTVTLAWLSELQRVIALDPHQVGVPSANWTTGLLAAYLAERTGIAVGQETVRRHLHRLDYVCKRPTWTVEHKAHEQGDYLGNACGRSCS
jgi:transposase